MSSVYCPTCRKLFVPETGSPGKCPYCAAPSEAGLTLVARAIRHLQRTHQAAKLTPPAAPSIKPNTVAAGKQKWWPPSGWRARLTLFGYAALAVLVVASLFSEPPSASGIPPRDLPLTHLHELGVRLSASAKGGVLRFDGAEALRMPKGQSGYVLRFTTTGKELLSERVAADDPQEKIAGARAIALVWKMKACGGEMPSVLKSNGITSVRVELRDPAGEIQQAAICAGPGLPASRTH